MGTEEPVTKENASLLLEKEGTDMGDIKEPIHVPKEGENDYGGGQKFKMLMEMARAKQNGSSSAAMTGTATTATTTTTGPATTTTPQKDQEQTLPPGWETAVDPSSGKTYYYNHALGESSLEIPSMPESVTKESAETSEIQENKAENQ